MRKVVLVEQSPQEADFAENCASLFIPPKVNQVIEVVTALTYPAHITVDQRHLLISLVDDPVDVNLILDSSSPLSQEFITRVRDQVIAKNNTDLETVQNAALTRVVARLGEPASETLAATINELLFKK